MVVRSLELAATDFREQGRDAGPISAEQVGKMAKSFPW